MLNTAPGVEVLNGWRYMIFKTDFHVWGGRQGLEFITSSILLPSWDFQEGRHLGPVLGQLVSVAQSSPLKDSGPNPSTSPALGS